MLHLFVTVVAIYPMFRYSCLILSLDREKPRRDLKMFLCLICLVVCFCLESGLNPESRARRRRVRRSLCCAVFPSVWEHRERVCGSLSYLMLCELAAMALVVAHVRCRRSIPPSNYIAHMYLF